MLSEKNLQSSYPQTFRQPAYRLTYSKYDLKQGLEIIYEDIEGKKIFFQTKEVTQNRFQIRVSHYNLVTKKIETLIESKVKGGKNRILIADVDLADVLNQGRKNKQFDEIHLRKLKTFVRTIEGSAMIDGIAAIYLSLDTANAMPGAMKLKVPLGLIRTTLESITKQFNGIDHLEKLVSTEKLQDLSRACESRSNCIISNGQFVLYRSGLFDVLSNFKKSNQYTKKNCEITTLKSKGIFPMIPVEDCFGICGLGCDGALQDRQLYTDECRGHDYCVSQYSHADCFWSVPEDCLGCNTFFEALTSYLCAIFPVRYPA